MPDKTVIETIYGKHHKYDVLKESTVLGGIKFWIYKDGKPHRGPFSDLRHAVEAAKQEG